MSAILAVIAAGVAAFYLFIGAALALATVVEAALLDYRLRWRWVAAMLVAWPLCLLAAGKRAAELERDAAGGTR